MHPRLHFLPPWMTLPTRGSGYSRRHRRGASTRIGSPSVGRAQEEGSPRRWRSDSMMRAGTNLWPSGYWPRCSMTERPSEKISRCTIIRSGTAPQITTPGRHTWARSLAASPFRLTPPHLVVKISVGFRPPGSTQEILNCSMTKSPATRTVSPQRESILPLRSSKAQPTGSKTGHTPPIWHRPSSPKHMPGSQTHSDLSSLDVASRRSAACA